MACVKEMKRNGSDAKEKDVRIRLFESRDVLCIRSFYSSLPLVSLSS